VFLQAVLGKTGGRTWFFDGEFVVGLWVISWWIDGLNLGLKICHGFGIYFFGYSRFGNGFLPAVGSEGGFGLGREKQDEDQGFGGEHAEGGLLSVPVP
jgi:hypothetical protein